MGRRWKARFCYLKRRWTILHIPRGHVSIRHACTDGISTTAYTQNNINGSFTGEYEDNSAPEEPPNLLINRADSIVMLCPLTFRLHFCPCIALHMEGPKLDAPRIRRAFSPKKLSCGCLTRPISAALNYILPTTDLW